MSLFKEFAIRSIKLKNRVAMSPMCMYSAVDGVPSSPFHMAHLLSRAHGGAGLIFTEATGVSAEGRISPRDTGIWTEAQVAAWKPIVEAIREAGAVAGMQIAHAGRKASTHVPWVEGGRQLRIDEGGWETVAPSAIPFQPSERAPRELSVADIREIVGQWRAAAANARAAGFDVLEIHAAHGYLLHEFLSPLSNSRSDEYGGSFENRTRIVKDIVSAVREVWPHELPLFVRISATDWAEHALPSPIEGPGRSWDLEQSVRLARELKDTGLVDLVDTSSGGTLPSVDWSKIVKPCYQAPFAARIRREAGIATGAVGVITTAAEAEAIISEGQADLVLLGRELLRNPMWPHLAAAELGLDKHRDWIPQYRRGAPVVKAASAATAAAGPR